MAEGKPAFTKSKESYGWPEPQCNNLHALNDTDLADYIAACGNEYDGMGQSVRVALVRLLRKQAP